ncbi:hypothetical protein [Pseudoalteromonas prydzensis]|uniref:hypothetical protein n=1 Tax=Pseudoalteromonas prydzensis TaxID=182141 RepID=UPI003703EF89
MREDSLSVKINELHVLKIKAKPPKNALHGEVDIIIEASKKDLFSRCTSLSDPTVLNKNVKYISWHAYYENDSKKIKDPVINIHSKLNRTKTIRHKSVVDVSEKFAFPIATVFLNTVKIIGQKPNGNMKSINLANKDCALDIFVLPRNVTFDEYIQTFTSLFIFATDMAIYDSRVKHRLSYIEPGKDSIPFNVVINGWCFILRQRFVCSQETLPNDEAINLCLYNPDIALNSLINRYYAAPNEELRLVKDRYEEEKNK